MSKYLLAAIQEHNPGQRAGDATLATWARDFDLTIRIDHRGVGELRTVIDWAHRGRDTFWRAHILSGKKVREKFDQLWIQASNQRKSGTGGLSAQDCYDRALALEAMEGREKS